jgi:hypothetical protein
MSLMVEGLVLSPSDEGRLSFLFLVAILLSCGGGLAHNKCSGLGLVGSTLEWEYVGFDEWILAVGESVNKLLAMVGGSVCFGKGILAVGESVNEWLAVGGLVCFGEGILAVGESVNEWLAVGGSVCFDKGLAMGESINELLAVGGSVCFGKGIAVGESDDKGRG